MLKIQKLVEEAKLPTRAYEGDAGLDLYAVEDAFIPVYNAMTEMLEFATKPKGAMIEIKTGICLEIPEGKYGEIHCRSSLGRLGMRVYSNILDFQNRGKEIIIYVQNLGHNGCIIKKGEIIAKLYVKKYESFEIQEVDEIK